jgi:hypothetical protein
LLGYASHIRALPRGGQDVSRVSTIRTAGRAPFLNWSGDAFTAITMFDGKLAACLHAERSTHFPILTIMPVFLQAE